MHCTPGWQEGNYAIWLKHFAYWGESNLVVIENSIMSLLGQKKLYQIKKTPPSHP